GRHERFPSLQGCLAGPVRMKEPAVSAHSFPGTEINRNKPSAAASLVERLDPAIGETSTMMGAMLAELVRRALRNSVVHIDEELQDHVAHKVDGTIADRMPAIEHSAAEVADKTARVAATEVAVSETRALEQRTQETCRHLETRIDQTAETAHTTVSETARNLSGRIEDAEKKAEQTLSTKAQELTGRILDTEKRAEQILNTRAEELTGRILEAEKRATEQAQNLISREVKELMDRARQASAQMKARLAALDRLGADLGQRLAEESGARKTAHDTLRTELGHHAQQVASRLVQEQHDRQALEQAVAALRQELAEA